MHYIQPTKIDWKDGSKNLTKLHPRVTNPENPEDIEEHGSFFHLFESDKVTREVRELISFVLHKSFIFDVAIGARERDSQCLRERNRLLLQPRWRGEFRQNRLCSTESLTIFVVTWRCDAGLWGRGRWRRRWFRRWGHRSWEPQEKSQKVVMGSDPFKMCLLSGFHQGRFCPLWFTTSSLFANAFPTPRTLNDVWVAAWSSTLPGFGDRKLKNANGTIYSGEMPTYAWFILYCTNASQFRATNLVVTRLVSHLQTQTVINYITTFLWILPIVPYLQLSPYGNIGHNQQQHSSWEFELI